VPAPVFQAEGTIVRSTGALTVAWPTPHAINDVGFLFVETANQAPTLSTPAGFVQVTQQGTGTAGTSGATMLTVFSCRATSTSQASPVVADSGDHQVAVIVTVRGCITTGNPWDVFAGSVQASAQTGYSIPGVTTTVANTLNLLALSNNGDASTNQIGPTPTNANLTNIVERADSQPIPSGQATSLLRYGPYGGMNDLVGYGPGSDTGAPWFSMAGFVPHANLANLGAQIDLADTLDVMLFVIVANTPSNYGVNTANGFVLGCSDPTNLATFDPAGTKSFCGQLKTLAASADWAKLQDAFARKRAVAYILDEPYHLKWNNSAGNPTLTPVIVNQACRALKTIVGGPVLTVLRADPAKLRTGTGGGWSSETVPTYDAVDYSMKQYEGPDGSAGLSFDGMLATARADCAAINIGAAPTLNLWAGGIRDTTDTVAATWDYLNDGSSSGVIAGTAQPSNSIFSPGQQIPAATWNATPNASRGPTVASPDWIRRCIDKVYNDPDLPWFALWTWPSTALGQISPWSEVIWARSDYIAALDYAINKAKTRSSATALLTPKA
jgi:hypothetical protein